MATTSATARKRQATVDVQDIEGADPERIGTLSSVLGSAEIEVGAPEEIVPDHLRNRINMIRVRINEDIEEMSYVGGGQRESYSFKMGHEYLVPWYIANELENNGKVWH
jgi:hypothetical protein